VSEVAIGPDAAGRLVPEQVPTGETHTFVLRTLTLDHRYHDEDPVQNAAFTVKFSNGFELKGTLDAKGKAKLVGVPAHGEVRYGPDQRPFQRVDSPDNPDQRGSFSAGDFETLFAKYQT